MKDEKPFPLEQWFDLSGRIDRSEIELAEAQIALYSVKDGEEPDSIEVKTCCRSLRAAARAHNAQFEKTPGRRKKRHKR